MSLVARDGTRAPGAGIFVAAFQCQPGSGGETGCNTPLDPVFSTTDAQGAYLLGLDPGSAQILTGTVAGYLAFEANLVMAPGQNVLNIDLHGTP